MSAGEEVCHEVASSCSSVCEHLLRLGHGTVGSDEFSNRASVEFGRCHAADGSPHCPVLVWARCSLLAEVGEHRSGGRPPCLSLSSVRVSLDRFW
jgi:hypothetical protein